jgi:hypothetical protein
MAPHATNGPPCARTIAADGEAWNHVTYEQACSRAYRWGEDGLARFCDAAQRLCLALALWNGEAPILKERLFGLSGPEVGYEPGESQTYMFGGNSNRRGPVWFPMNCLIVEALERFHGREHRLQADPNFSSYIWFREYFHGDTGVGLAASHQAGWTGLVANLLHKQGRRRS